jgi:hypothetical protein
VTCSHGGLFSWLAELEQCQDAAAREKAASQAISYMEEMKQVPAFEWLGGQIPNDMAPQPHIRIHDKDLIVRHGDPTEER